MKARMIWY